MDEKSFIKIFFFIVILYFLFRSPSYEVDVEYVWDKNHPPKKATITLNPHFLYTQNTLKSDTLPLIIALTGDSANYENFEQIVFKDFPIKARVAILESPGRLWPRRLPELEFYAEAIAKLANQLTDSYPTSGKPVLFGFSGGAMMSYYSALTHCEDYAFVMPVDGSLHENKKAFESLITMDETCKVVAFHGYRDSVVPIAQGKDTFNFLEHFSSDTDFISYDGVHLGVFNEFNELIMNKLAELVMTTL